MCSSVFLVIIAGIEWIGRGDNECTAKAFASCKDSLPRNPSKHQRSQFPAKVIAHTRDIGLVSIPGAYTATEIAMAAEGGADFIKLFPADDASSRYVKAVKAPLSDVKLLAVGGVNAENVQDLIGMGFSGVGVGSNLYNKRLIEAKNYAALTNLAKKYVEAVKNAKMF